MIRSIPPRTILDKLRKKGERNPENRTVKPREWVYETKPVFKRIRSPLIDVFREAEEVRIIIDMGSFSRGEIDIDIQPDRYIITAVRDKQVFCEEILIPEDVDRGAVEENYRNGILELTLPKKSRPDE